MEVFMFQKLKEKSIQSMRKAQEKVKGRALHQTVLQEILCGREGSGILEYVGIGAAALIVIVVIILPGLKSLFGVDIFPGLTSTVDKIFNYKT